MDLSRLTSLALLNFTVSSTQVAEILLACPDLAELFITISTPQTLETAELGISRLEILHLTGTERALPRLEDLTRLAVRLPTVQQIGCGNRVYEVFRGKGDVELARWGRIDIPRYFQVWRG